MQILEKSKAVLLRPAELKTYERGGGARTTPLVTRSIGSDSFITGITSFEPGAVIPFHSHNVQESVMLLEGEAIMDIDGQSIPVRLHDTTFIPPNVSHRFRNASSTQPMKILWIYASPDATRTLTETGATNPVAVEHK